jgi:hypothetical protein
MAKKWHIREKNSSRYVEGDWIYYVQGNIWGGFEKANYWRTKKEAAAYLTDILKRGEVYGE